MAEQQSGLVTEEELKQLPHTAQVAFAARAALRVLPAIGYRGDFKFWGADTRKHIMAIQSAIHAAILFSLDRAVVAGAGGGAGAASATASAGGAGAASAAASAASAAFDAAYAAYPSAFSSAFSSSSSSVAVSHFPQSGLSENILKIMRDDYETIKSWTVDAPGGKYKSFYERDLWPDKPESWVKVENNFKKALADIGLSEIFKRYQSGGAAYINLPLEPIEKPVKSKKSPGKRKTAKKENKQISENIEIDDQIEGEGFKKETAEDENEQTEETLKTRIENLTKQIFSIVSHQVKPALGVERHAAIVAQLLENFRYERGQFVGIFGQWGRGKTYFWQQVVKYFKDKNQQQTYSHLISRSWKNLVANKNEKESFIEIIKDFGRRRFFTVHFTDVTFHAWKYQDTPASWAYLYETLAEVYLKKRANNVLSRFILSILGRIELNLWRGKWKKPVYTFIVVIFVGFLFIFANSNLLLLFLLVLQKISFASISLLIIGLMTPSVTTMLIDFLKKDYSIKAIDLFEKLTKKVSFEGYLGAQAEIQKELKYLLKAWFPEYKLLKKISPNFRGRRLLLFVDDIDRCEEERIIQIVDALRVMLEDDELVKRMIVVTAVDERILKRAILNKYDKLVKEKWFDDVNEYKSFVENLTREYLDKLFITGIKLMNLTNKQLGDFFDNLTENADEKGRIVVNPIDILKKEEMPAEVSRGESDVKVDGEEASLPEPEHGRGAAPEAMEGPVKLDVMLQGQTDDLQKPKKYELEQYEKHILDAVVQKIPEATPRQVRIWYYRYLLSMQLLQPMLEKYNDEENLKLMSNLVAKLLIVFGLQHPVEVFQSVAEKINNSQNEKFQLSFPAMEIDIELDSNIVRNIFEVLEMVIAY